MQPRKSDEQVVREYLPKIGPVMVEVTAINPTLTEMVGMGMNTDKEPEYITVDNEGIKTVRLDVYVENKEVNLKTKFALFITNKEWKSKAGKFAIINNLCQGYFDSFCVWQESVEAAVAMQGRNGNTWFDEKGARIALVGEPDLYRFIFTWFNLKPNEDECVINIQKLFNGDFSELKGFVKMCAANKNVFQVMATANNRNDNWYQSINNRCFGRATSKKFITDFIKYAANQKEQGYELKEVWSTELKDLDISQISIPTPDPEPETTDNKAVGDFPF